MDFGADFLDDALRKRTIQGLGDFHLRSALVRPDIDALTTGRGRNREVRAFHRLKSYHNGPLVQVNLCSLLYLLCTNLDSPSGPGFCQEELIDALDLEKTALADMLNPNDPFHKAVDNLKKEGLASEYSKLKEEISMGLMHLLAICSDRPPVQSEAMKLESGVTLHSIRGVTFYYWGELVTLVRPPGEEIELMNLDHYRMICDKITERDNVLIATRIGHNIFPEIYPAPNLIRKIFSLFDSYLNSRGNEGYKLLKAYEAIVTGSILSSESSGFWDSSVFLRSTIDGLDPIDQPVAHHFLNILRESKSIHHLTQIGGLFRLWGHPIINAIEGMEKVRKIASVPKVIDPVSVKMSGRSFKEIFFTSYFKKHGVYPHWSSEPSSSEDSYVVSSLKGSSPIVISDLEYDWADWDKINCEKTFDIPETFNLSMIVADTAISPTRSELAKCFQEKRPALGAEMRRGVIKWMKDGMIDCGSLLRKIDDYPLGLPKNHRAIGLYPKEREMNPIARMFALTTLLLRSYIVVTESMLSDNILPYIPGITMTHSLLQLTKEMIRITWRQKGKSEVGRSFCINMDFEKWNINMRQESTKEVFLQLGRLFGLETIYDKTYTIFKNSIIYLADGSFIPEIDPHTLDPMGSDRRLYLGHMGGLEGLRQKGWTIFTVVIIARICKELKVDWQLMGQGDNQVLMVTAYSKYSRRYGIDSPEAKADIQRTLEKLMRTLIKEFEGVGLSLKPLETWISDTYFSYGKIPIYRGVPCAMSLKKISRVFYFSNEDLMTLDNALGAVGANAQSAVMGDVHPIVPYVIAKWQQISCIRVFSIYHPLIGKGLRGSATSRVAMRSGSGVWKTLTVPHVLGNYEETMILATIPKTLGGYNTINYFRMMMRGFPDPQNMDFQWLSKISSSAQTTAFGRFLFNMVNLMINPETNYSYLVQDVTGINLFIPTNSTQVIKDMIHKTIDGLNFDSEFAGWFKTVLKQSEHKTIEALVQELCQGEEINVRLVHDVIGATLYGYCDSITSKIDKTVTLSRIALGSEDVVSTLIQNEIRFFSFFRWRLCMKGNLEYDGGCPSKYIRRAREIGWKKRLIGVDTPFPFHFLTRASDRSDRPDSYVRVISEDFARNDQGYMLTHVGNALPYLGSMTKEKIGASGQRLAYGNEPLLTRPINLLRAVGWFIKEDSNYSDLFCKLVRAVSDLDPNTFIVKQEKVKGSMVHRYNDDGTKHGSLWMPLYGPATYLNLSTNHLLEYTKGSKNVTLHFQALLCYVQYIAVNSLMSSDTPKVLDFFKGCNDCIQEVPEEFEDLPSPIPMDIIPSCVENPYLYIPLERIPLEFKTPKILMSSFKTVTIESVPLPLLSHYMTTWLACKITSQLIAGGDDSSDRGLIDIGGISRVIYLKVDPLTVMDTIGDVLWIVFGRQEKYLREGSYPSWRLIRNDIVRTLSRTPLSQFNTLGGFFLWDESKRRIESALEVIHFSYPMTATSIAQASREALIKRLSTKSSVSLAKTSLILNGEETQSEILIKMAMIGNVEDVDKEGCPHCIKGILSLRISLSHSMDIISHVRCKLGHFLLDTRFDRFIRRSGNISIESIFDMIPPDYVLDKTSLTRPKSFEQLAPKEDRFDEFLSYKILPIPSVRQKEKSQFQTLTRFTGVDLRYGIVTRGMYRAAELSMRIRKDFQRSLLVLGDGLGGTSLGFRMFGRWDKILAWTYIDISEGIPHSSELSRPPLHFSLNTEIDCSLSMTKCSVVGTEQFAHECPDVISSNQIFSVVSDIEWWYLGKDMTVDLIRTLRVSKAPTAYIRVFLSSLFETPAIFETSINSYLHWGLFFTDSCSPNNNSGWLYLRGPRKADLSTVLTREQHSYLQDHLIIASSEYSYKTNVGDDSKRADDYLNTDRTLSKFYRGLIVEYFRDVGIIDFLDYNCTKLFLGLRVGRRPEAVSNMGGNTLYYDREEGRHRTMLRLLLLACSMLRSRNQIEEILSRHWELNWEVRKESTLEVRRYVRTNIILQSTKRKSTNISSKESREILSRVRLLADMREEYNRNGQAMIQFEEIGKSVTFKYVPTHLLHNHQHECFFLISKISSYSTV